MTVNKDNSQKKLICQQKVFIQIQDDPLKIKYLQRKNVLLLISYM